MKELPLKLTEGNLDYDENGDFDCIPVINSLLAAVHELQEIVSQKNGDASTERSYTITELRAKLSELYTPRTYEAQNVFDNRMAFIDLLEAQEKL